jgi:glutaredoxin
VRPRVTLYTRPGCGLCDEARAIMLAVRGRTPFDLAEVDVSTDDHLEIEFGIRIPVVEVDGEELFEIAVDERAFEAAIRLRV